MKSSKPALAAALVFCLVPAPSLAAAQKVFGIAAGPLASALDELAQQSGISVGATDPGVSSARTSGVRGRMSARSALQKILSGTGYRAVPIDGSTYRLAREAPRKPSRTPVRSSSPAAVDNDTIIVTASKSTASLLRFPGTVTMVQTAGDLRFGANDKRDMHLIAAGTSILQTTDLGDGRNKLFIRGIADSSFAGPTRSTANVYFGEVQLGYNGADPNLNLYDIDRVEILEGPQGALYGAGAIGGIIRLSPNAPDASRFTYSGLSSIASTQGGAASYGLAGMANLPLLSDRIAVRTVGFYTRDGGYINDTGRNLRNINRTTAKGGRASLRITPGDGWTADFGLIIQQTDARDMQYTVRGAPGLSRASSIAQPFDGDFLLLQAVINKRWDSGLQLLAASGSVKHHSDDRFDATPRTRPDLLIAYDTHDRNQLYTQEVRLTRAVANGNSWLIGLAYIGDHDAIQRELGSPNNPQDIVGVTNQSTDLSVFGEGTIAATQRLSLTAGSRLTWARTDSDPVFTRRDNNFIRGRSSVRFSPMLAANMLIAPRLSWFARYGSGFRTGGLAVAPGIGRVANFTPDSIHVIESGLRLQRQATAGLAASISISRARWNAIQADLIDRRGFPYTTNIGDGRIVGIEASVDWVPSAGLHLTGSTFYNHSSLTNPITPLSRQEGAALPVTPGFAANGGVGYQWTRGGDATMTVMAAGRYTGHSFVGVGTMLNVKQGDYAAVDLSAGWKRHGIGISLNFDNLLDQDGNRFALGNPFGVAARDQMTPLRPRTGRLTLTYER